MADFWGGVGKGFAHGFEKSYDSAARRRERKDERDDRLTDLKEAAINTAIADYIKAGGTRTGAIASRDLEVLQTETAELLKAQRDAVLKRADDEKIRSAMSTLAKAHPDVQKEAYQSVEGIPIEGTNYLDDARTLSPTTGELKKTPLDVLERAASRSEAQRTLANKLAEEKRDEDRDIAAEVRKRAHDFKMKRTLAPQHPKTPELSTEDAADKIIQMQGQLGQRVPTQSREALLAMGRGPIMKLYGALTQQVAGIVQPTAAERDDAKLDEFAIEYDGASPARKAQIIRQAQTIFSKRGEGKWTPEDVTKYLQSGQPPEEVVVPFEETAEEREQRGKRLSMLKNMDDLLQTAEKQDWTGLIPGLKSEFFDKILPAGGLDKFANIKRLKFRSTLGANAYAMARELLEESRMTDADFQHLRKYTPEEWMEKPEVLAKLRSLNELVRAKLMIQDKRAGKAPLFSLSPVEFFNQMDVPNEKFGDAITVPSEIAPAVIRNSLNFRYIDGDEKKPVTADYISGLFREGKIDENAGTLWIHYLGLPLK